jgi:hypothetical protein
VLHPVFGALLMLSAAEQVYGYALYKNGKYAQVAYPTEGYPADISGRSFHHGITCQGPAIQAPPPTALHEVACNNAVMGLMQGDSCRD